MSKLEIVGGDDCDLVIKGRIDSISAVELEKMFSTMGDEDISFDLSELEYISSAGLRAFLQLKKLLNRTGHALKILHVSESAKEIFDITGFSGILGIEED